MENIETIIVDSETENEDDMELDSNDILPKTSLTIAEEKKNAGNDHYKAQEYQLALRCYSDAIAICPDAPAFYGNRAACFMMLGDYKSALADARESIQYDATFEKGYVRIAKCCLALGDVVAAEQAIKMVLELDARSTAVATEIQNCKLLRACAEEARQYYQKQDYRAVVYHSNHALKIAPACIKHKLLKAECFALLGRIEEANDLAVSCMQSDATNAEAAYVRGLCLYYSDSLEKGLLHFQRALALDPDNAKARAMRIKAKNLKEKKEKGNELFKVGKFREAQIIYTEALAIDPRNKDINSKLHYNRALVNVRIGSLSDAIHDCTCALSTNTAYLKALLLRARCQSDLKNFAESVKDYEAALKMERTPEIKKSLNEAKLALKKSKRKDYYKILGIDKNASELEIKKAYRKRALVHHPDRHANASDEEKRQQETAFKEVGEAYNVLSDQQKRLRYDTGQDLEEEQGEFDPNQIYRQFFNFCPTGNSGGGSSFVFQF